MHSGKLGSAERKRRWGRAWIPSYIQSSNYFHAPPLCLKWILRSQKWRISTFHPSYLLHVLFLLCHSGACVINLLSAHANRTLQSFSLSLEACLRQLSFLLKMSMSPCSFPSYRNPAAFGWDPEQEKRWIWEEEEERDRLTGQCRSVTVISPELSVNKVKLEPRVWGNSDSVRFITIMKKLFSIMNLQPLSLGVGTHSSIVRMREEREERAEALRECRWRNREQ